MADQALTTGFAGRALRECILATVIGLENQVDDMESSSVGTLKLAQTCQYGGRGRQRTMASLFPVREEEALSHSHVGPRGS